MTEIMQITEIKQITPPERTEPVEALVDVSTYIWSIIPQLLEGAWVSIKLAAVGLTAGLLLGLPLALLRSYGNWLLRLLAITYIEIFRGTPLLLQLFIIYYGLPDVGIILPRFVAAWAALGLNSAAYQAEYFRGAFQAVDPGQLVAARSIGMTRAQAILHMVLPQALRLVIPPWTNEAVYIVKYAAVAFTVAVPDLLARGKILNASALRPIEIFLTVAAIYVIMLSSLGSFMQWIEKKVRIPGLILESGRD